MPHNVGTRDPVGRRRIFPRCDVSLGLRHPLVKLHVYMEERKIRFEVKFLVFDFVYLRLFPDMAASKDCEVKLLAQNTREGHLLPRLMYSASPMPSSTHLYKLLSFVLIWFDLSPIFL